MSGNIGVGLTAPVAPLHFYKAGTGDVEVARFTNPTADENALITIGNSTTADDSGFIVYDQSSDYMSIGVTGDSHSAGATLVVENGGMVGIGTTNPTALLEVGGASTYDGEIKVTSDAGLTATLEADDDGNYIHVGSSTNHDFSVVRNDKTMVELDSTGVIFKNVAGTTGVAIIEDGGNVGIGTTSATAQLDIKGNPTGGRLLELDRIAHAWLDDVGVLGMSASSGIGDDFFYIGDGTNQYMSILMDGGNVGIGTVNPNYVLEVMMEDNSPAINIAEKDVNNRRATMGFGLDSGTTTGWIMGQSSANNTTKDFYQKL